MGICGLCHQPITNGSTQRMFKNGGAEHIGTELGVGGACGHESCVGGAYGSHLGCPTPDQFIDNLVIAMKQGFVPEFCRTHYLDHVEH